MNARTLTLFLCGDVMTGRGIDQILPVPSDPHLFESYLTDARRYVALAEARSGPLPRQVGSGYIWGDLGPTLARADRRIINLETAVTVSDAAWDKGINYRMHPANVACLTAAGIDACVLANNHVLDWGREGLIESLNTLRSAGLVTAGAGSDQTEAERPAVLPMEDGARLLIYAYGLPTSGIPHEWAAQGASPGVNFLPDLTAASAERVIAHCHAGRRPGDFVILSIHWGGNWGFNVPPDQIDFAHRLLDSGAVDLIHGHSSHHVKAIEVYAGKLILYGCGDFLNDYEGIGGYEAFRGDLALAYLPELEMASGQLLDLRLVPVVIRQFRVNLAGAEDAGWLATTLSREGHRFGTRVEVGPEALNLRWD